jgi:hypothetical protein
VSPAFYDLGHGLCTYGFFDQCPHRKACAKCSFYRSKGCTHPQLLEAKANLLHLKQEIPLTDEVVSAVNDGLEALDRLCSELADVPTPAGPTPRDLASGCGFVALALVNQYCGELERGEHRDLPSWTGDSVARSRRLQLDEVAVEPRIINCQR